MRNIPFYSRACMAFAVMLLALCLVQAIEVQDQTPKTASVGTPVQLTILLRAEKNYSTQHISYQVEAEPTVLLNGCNKTINDVFYINRNSWAKVHASVLFSHPGEYTITYTLSNTRYNQTNTTKIIVTGQARNIKEACTKAVGNRKERYGMYDTTTVKDRLKTTVRKYAIW